MLAFAGEGGIYDADQVSERTCAWANRIRSFCVRAEDDLAERMSPISEL